MQPTRGQDPNQGRDDPWAPRPDPTQDRFSAWDDAPPPSAAWQPPPPPPPPPSPVQPAYQPYSHYGQNQYGPYQQAPAPGAYQQPPNNYLVLAVLTTIFCFMPFGIVSIIKASSVNTLWSQGRVAEAFRASEQAKNWAIAALVALPVFFGGFFLLALIGALAG